MSARLRDFYADLVRDVDRLRSLSDTDTRLGLERIAGKINELNEEARELLGAVGTMKNGN